jgi:hypothetical protein
MVYVQIPVPFDAPGRIHLQRFFAAMAMFEAEPIWVHCAMNLRVSAFMYHYLRRIERVGESQARSPILSKWAPHMDAIWRDFLAMQPGEEFR